ncbi:MULTISPECIES: replication endonuclease [unclassified Polaromonas]|uniref:replication endonuclease n=1 Tax=unclassified Polaromonas TaxID=2638319 RepID=UPI0018CBADDC|nr:MULTISPECIES: replication endonuclease [unclassified Polaromonas]MBG6074011.1 hypothetical protein [Polaromonas sp. CG_9.7]MBG6116031.1 hypothetical protein [Polaromonas sp. CG_9.2]
MTAYQPNLATQNWIERQVSDLPPRWKKKLVNRWHAETPGGKHYRDERGHHPEFFANTNLKVWADRLSDSRLPLDASDADICNAADQLAARSSELAKIYHDLASLRAAMNRLAQGQDVTSPEAWDAEKETGVQDGPAVARMADPIWWRRMLRRVHAKLVEGAAIDLGYVNRAKDCYVSNESVYRRAKQNERIAATLEETILVNELGQEFKLAELAAKGPANKAIRRAELMTRISGFERIALEMGHAGLFFTMTCPSRMHKWATVKGADNRVFENKRYDGTSPGQAQKYLAKVWSRIRAKLARQGIGQYGFRIAEPNHDGTPHWHLLVFVPPEQLADLQATVWKYALQDSPNEPGASTHRVDFKPIDAGKGTAAGYIAKYVAKNIDGFKLDTDLYGNDGVTASHRVETWAATWRIRQFQQVGGAPVGPWRELRRIKNLPSGAPQHLIDAHHAVNKITNMEAGTVKSVSWAHYIQAQGGVYCGCNARIKISKTQPEGMNRYGEKAAKRPIGIETVSAEQYKPAHMAHMGGQATRFVHWIVESERHVWQVASRVANPNSPAASRPWTCVNNCTQGDEADEASALRLDFLRGSEGENREKPRTGLMKKNIEQRNDFSTGLHSVGNEGGQADGLINALPGTLSAMPTPQACCAIIGYA